MKLKLKEIAAISGKPGLFKIIKPTRTGVIVESLDKKKIKLAVGAAHRVSILKEVSIYTTNKEGSTPLEEVFHKIYELHQGEPPVTGKSEKDELVQFMEGILPDYDREKVYVSDMKKLIGWYLTIQEASPLTLEYLLREEELDALPEPEPEVVEPAPKPEKKEEPTPKPKNKLTKKARKKVEEEEKQKEAELLAVAAELEQKFKVKRGSKKKRKK